MQDEIIRVLFEFAIKHLYPAQNPSEAERMAIVATGGYGRGVLAAGSDIDLLFLLPYKQTAWGESVAETILYCLWDMGLKVGHATRSVNECIRQAKADMTIRTALLEARYLLGDHKLFDELVARFDKEVVQGTAAEFVAAKLAEREERHRRAGQSRYLVEPNVKDGKGGLRDLHTLYWIAKYVYRVREREELIEHGVFDPREYRRFRRCGDFLWAVRCHMHFLTGRAEERLSFDIQREIAVRLGYTEHPGLRDVERFMKHYFLIAKDVGDLTAILCAKLEDSQAKPMPVLSRMMAKFRPRAAAHAERDRGFRRRLQPHQRRRRERVQARSGQSDPHLPSRAEIQSGVPSRRDARRHALAQAHRPDAARERGGEPPIPGNPDLEERRRNRAAAHERGRRAGPLRARLRPHRRDDAVQHVPPLHGGRASPALHRRPRRHRGRPNRGHQIRQRADAEHSAAAPRSCSTSRCSCTTSPRAGSRTIRSPAPASRASSARGSGFSPAETETVAWLIEQHLVMSTVAQSRDLSDRKTIENFTAVVQSVERLKLLTILTAADIKAVGPGVWNGWKAQLIRTLYYETEPVLTGGYSEVNRAQRVAVAQAEFRGELADWTAAEIDAYIALHYPAYWLKVDLPQKIAHARFLRSAAQAGKSLATSVSFPAARGVTELTVLAPDHPWLLSIIAGACAVAGANIVDAQIFTTTDGRALDTISVSREFEFDADEARRAARITNSIEKALRGDLKLPEVVAKRETAKARLKAFAVPPEVTVNNGWSNRYTMVEVTGLDRPGLLFELTATLSKLTLNIASAHVATFGERVVDVFYVTDLFGAKITSATRQATIKRALIALLTPAPAVAERPAKGAAAG